MKQYIGCHAHGRRPLSSPDFHSQRKRRVRRLQVVNRKQLLREVIPSNHPGMLYASDLGATNTHHLFEEIVKLDLEGLVLKWKQSTYGAVGKWVKIKNPQYSQAVSRHELFTPRRKSVQSAVSRVTAKSHPNGA